MNIVDYLDRAYIERFVFKIDICRDIQARRYRYSLNILCEAKYDNFMEDSIFFNCIETDYTMANFLRIPLDYYMTILAGCGGVPNEEDEEHKFSDEESARKACEQLYCAWVMLRLVGEI